MVTAVTNYGRSGLHDWIVQRATAIILFAYFVFIMFYLLTNPGIGYAEWKALFEMTSTKVFSLLALLSVCAHAWIGLWCVSTDYITERLMGPKATVLRLLFQAVCGLFMFTYLVWGFEVLWG